MPTPPRATPDGRRVRWRDRFLLRFVRFIVPYLYEEVQVLTLPDGAIPPDAPVLVVSNHFGGFADPLVLMYGSPEVPRIVARDKIWRIPFAGWIMNWIGAIPVHKPKEHVGEVSNDTMFRSCYDALAARLSLLIFPEGITREDPSIAPLKTGAARIALGARRAGAAGIHILPVGIHYEDKAALRSRIFVNAGEPIDLDAWVDGHSSDGDASPENRALVRSLTDDIEVYLRDVAPDFTDWQEARSLTLAAEATLRVESADPTEAVPIVERDLLAADLAHSGDDDRGRIVAATEELQRDLEAIGLSDREMSRRVRMGGFVRYLLWSALVLLVAIPIALVGLTINLWPILLVWAISFVPVDNAVKATAKPFAAILFFGIAWGVALWQAFEESVVAGILGTVLLPVSLAALIYASERVVRIVKAGRLWLKGRKVEALTTQVEAKRRQIHAAVRAVAPTS